jgi:hypothetical protein
MQGVRFLAAAALALAACGGADARDRATPDAPAVAAHPPAAPRTLTATDSAAVRARVAARGDSLRAAFARATPLGAREVAMLRQDRNAEQVATAQRLGIRAGSEAATQALARGGRLVALGDSTAWWVLRDMDHSVPFVTPDTRAMLEALGRRFHARLDRLGLPRYRMKVTSALRTDETQQDLRRTNTYAARSTSAHEFGTTVDVSHERFAVPADARPDADAALGIEREMLEAVGKEHAKVLQAELGRAIQEMRGRGMLHVMMENQQPVYHMTVARRLAAAPR